MRNVTDDFADLLTREPTAQAVRTVGLDRAGHADELRPLLDIGAEPGIGETAPVSIVACRDYRPGHLAAAMRDTVTHLRLPERLAGARSVVVKLGLVEGRAPDLHVTPHPELVGALLAALRRIIPGDATIVVADGPGHDRDTEHVLAQTGVAAVLAEHGVPFVDLNHDDVRRVEVPDPVALREVVLPVTVLDADQVISVAKVKTHHRAGVTLGMKNLFGCVPGAVYGFPKTRLHYAGTARVVADLASVIAPGLTVLDGVVAMEGAGPLDGRPTPLGAVVAGVSAATTDAVAATLMGFAPVLIPQFWYALDKGLMRRPEVHGEGVRSLQRDVEPPPNVRWLRGTAGQGAAERMALLERLLATA